MLRFGKISELGTGKYTGFARVYFDELSIASGWLSLPTYSTKDKFHFVSIPVNTQVAALMHSDGEQGVILQACWNLDAAPEWANENTDGVEYANGDKVLHTDDGFAFNDGENGGMCKTPELKTQLEKTNQLIEAITGILNGAQIVEPGNGSPSALQIALKAALVGKALGSYNNIENSKVKH